jgi:hypothetical protein
VSEEKKQEKSHYGRMNDVAVRLGIIADDLIDTESASIPDLEIGIAAARTVADLTHALIAMQHETDRQRAMFLAEKARWDECPKHEVRIDPSGSCCGHCGAPADYVARTSKKPKLEKP